MKNWDFWMFWQKIGFYSYLSEEKFDNIFGPENLPLRTAASRAIFL